MVFNKGSGYWNGTAGIVSTSAAGDTRFLTTLGYATGGAAGVSPFDGFTTASTDVLIKYTYYGDANLDGVVNGADYTQIDTGFGMHHTGWQNGDFNYDGVVDGSDYSLIDNAFNQISATGASPLAISTVPSNLIASSSEVIAVPEPASLGFLGIASAALLARRRRRNQ